MNHKKLKDSLWLFLFFILLLSQSSCIENESKKLIYPCGFSNVYDSKSSYRKYMFNFCDSLLKLDTLNIDEFGDDYLFSLAINVELILPKGYSLKKVVRNVHIYPVIAKNYGDDNEQILFLKEFMYRSNKELIMKDGNKFHYSHVFAGDDIVSSYRHITKEDLFLSINKSIQNQSIDKELKNIQAESWLMYSTRYKPGDFSDRSNQNFFVLWREVYLTLEIEHDGQTYNKVLIKEHKW